MHACTEGIRKRWRTTTRGIARGVHRVKDRYLLTYTGGEGEKQDAKGNYISDMVFKNCSTYTATRFREWTFDRRFKPQIVDCVRRFTPDAFPFRG